MVGSRGRRRHRRARHTRPPLRKPRTIEQSRLLKLIHGSRETTYDREVGRRNSARRNTRPEMTRSFDFVILGGGVAAGYAALEFVRRKGDAASGQLCIISDEDVPPYERPALSKGYLLPEGIELILGTRVISADVRQKTLLTSHDETISYKTLIVATGAKALKLEEIRVSGSDAENVCYLRNIKDAERLVGIMKSCPGGNAVVIGGGYIGMECAAALVTNKIKVTMVFPDKYCMARLFTPKIAEFYENYYMSKGVTFIKGTAVMSLEVSSGKVTTAILRDGSRLPADMVLAGIGARANTELFEDQLAMEKGGIKVNGQMQTSDASVYAVGDVASFPVKLFGGDLRRLEHVDCARQTARHAVMVALDLTAAGDIDYMPFFYSRVFALSGDNAGKAVHFGDFSPSSPKFGAFWVSEGQIAGAFLEGASPEEYHAIAHAVRSRAAVPDITELVTQGLNFVLREGQSGVSRGGGGDAPSYSWHATVGVFAALSIAAIYWLSRRALYLPKRDF